MMKKLLLIATTSAFLLGVSAPSQAFWGGWMPWDWGNDYYHPYYGGYAPYGYGYHPYHYGGYYPHYGAYPHVAPYGWGYAPYGYAPRAAVAPTTTESSK